jgi:hypothetical protein
MLIILDAMIDNRLKCPCVHHVTTCNTVRRRQQNEAMEEREREREREERKLLGNLSTLGRDAASLPPFIPMQTWEESKTVYKKTQTLVRCVFRTIDIHEMLSIAFAS